MVRFLIKRPVAVCMVAVACIVLGAISYSTLPVSLLPNIAIPQITVQVTGNNISARELENTVVAPLRRRLQQVSRLEDITSETRNGTGIIRLSFAYGVDTDLASIEVNEKIDATMGSLPREISRPKVIKASATDIPVFYLHLTEKEHGDNFQQMCILARQVIQRRIEQLPQVAIADVTGIPEQQLLLSPIDKKMSLWGLSINDLEQALDAANVNPSSLTIRNGYNIYTINMGTALRTPEEIGAIYLKKGDRLLQLRDVCDVSITSAPEEGMSTYRGKRAVTFAIIKQTDENMDDLKEELYTSIRHFEEQYPQIQFTISRNQTELLDYTISNLQENLILGFLLIFVVVFLFMRNVRSPLIIGISMISAVIITFIFFALCKVSLNIISLSGLIMAVGMMIDNSIIVTENITQYREQGYTLADACVKGTHEMITPMLSSTLTTIAVFIPLIFISGIAGALFFDEAFSVSAGLMVSYMVSILLLPVIYYLIERFRPQEVHLITTEGQPSSRYSLIALYDRGVDWTFRHKTLCLAGLAISIVLCVLGFRLIDKERMPAIDRHELIARIAWNEPIHTDENLRRIDCLQQALDTMVVEYSAYIGQQDYLIDKSEPLEQTEAEIYIDAGTPDRLVAVEQQITEYMNLRYPKAKLTLSPEETIFERLFTTAEPPIKAHLYAVDKSLSDDVLAIRTMEQAVAHTTGIPTTPTPAQQQTTLLVHRDRLLLYNVSYAELQRTLHTAFRSNHANTLRSFQEYLPIVIGQETKDVDRLLQELAVESQSVDDNGNHPMIPLSALATSVQTETPVSIVAGKDGEYIPLVYTTAPYPEQLVSDVRRAVDTDKRWRVGFSGTYFSNAEMMRELLVVLAVSILLMYFILSAQFESFTLPLIVLLEIPIDIAFALLLLMACGHTLNLMSAIGIITTCGVIINDSILKLDAIGELRRAGMPMMEAVYTAGRRRLRPIIMTSLTTILAMAPLLFAHDMGSELQKPLAIAMIGTMGIGTLVSLFFIPLVYVMVSKKDN